MPCKWDKIFLKWLHKRGYKTRYYGEGYLVINHKFKHGFIHVPKCAGMSMEVQKFVGGNGHQRISQIKSKAPDYFWWGFVRHPADRCLSMYSHMTQWPVPDFVLIDKTGVKHKLIQNISLQDFIYMLPYSYGVNMLTQPMTHYLCDDKLNIMVDFVGRYEKLERDWYYVQGRLGVQPVLLPHNNKSRHRRWWRVLTAEWLRVIETIYCDDYKVFGY